MNLAELTIAKAKQGLIDKEFSATELAKESLHQIQKQDQELKAFLSVTSELALAQAAQTDERIAKGEELSPLSGIPSSIKDAILLEGVACTAGSRILEEYIAPYDATVTQKMKQAGATIVGKTNLDEFAMGASTENSAFAKTKNPHDLSKVPGGSSGGSAVSVAAGQALVSLGSDTGGSIRQPAAFCGVVGLKPTYGRVSRYGLIALASSLDQIGPFAKTVEDAELVFHAIKGKDPKDATTVDWNKEAATLSLKDLRIGVPKEYFAEGLDLKVGRVVREAIAKYEEAGAKVQELSLPYSQYALATYYVINTAEASSNLARYDGIRYGLSQDAETLLDVYVGSRGVGLGNEVKRRIMLGTYALSAGYYDAYYLKAQQMRSLLKADFDAAFEQVDVIMGPVSPILPFAFGEKTQDPLAMYLADVYTVPVNLVGLPALSLPVGMVEKLPVGLHLIAPAFREDILFQAGKFFESMAY